MRRSGLYWVATTVALTMFCTAAWSQKYPARQVTMIVPFPAGGPSDVVARIMADGMSRYLGQTVVIENVGGAGGTIGTARAAAAEPDGYTILGAGMGSHVAAPALFPNLKYDSTKNFEPIGLTSHAPVAIVARKDFRPRTFANSSPTSTKTPTRSSRRTAAPVRRRTWRA